MHGSNELLVMRLHAINKILVFVEQNIEAHFPLARYLTLRTTPLTFERH